MIEKAVQQIMLGTVCKTEAQTKETLRCIKQAGYDGIELNGFMIRPTPFIVRMLTKFAGMPVGKGGNYHWKELLKEAGKTGLPVLLKRGLAATIDEWLNASEYIMSEGNPNVILCERGIRTFESATRNTLDLSAVPVLRQKTHLPVIVDPSHATGVRAYVAPMAKAAVAAGADGLMIEVHPCPEKALSDGPQSLTFREFESLMAELAPYAALEHRVI